MPVEHSSNSNKKTEKKGPKLEFDRRRRRSLGLGLRLGLRLVLRPAKVQRPLHDSARGHTRERERKRCREAGRVLAGGNPSIDDFLKGSSDVEAVEKGREPCADSASLGACNKPSDFNACRPRCRCRCCYRCMCVCV